MKLARKYACRYRGNDGTYVQHTSGYGTPTLKKCRRCGGPLDTETGLWGVFTWTGTGRYPEADAHEVFNVIARAERYAEKANAANPYANLVVRWISKVPS